MLHRYFRVGLVAAMAYPWYDAACLRELARDDYFDVAELNPIADEAMRKEAAAIFSQSHMMVGYSAHGRLFAGGLNPNSLDEACRAKAEQALRDGVDEARALGAGGIAFLAREWTQETRLEGLEQLVKTTVNACRYAAGYGMMVELEVFDHDIDKCALLGPASLAAEFAARVRESCPNFGLMADLSHFPMCREDSRYILRTLRPYLTHFHIGNTVIDDPAHDGYGDLHPRFGYPNSENDTAQVAEFLGLLRDEGFFQEGAPYILSFEVKPRPDEDARVVIANAKRVLNRAWALTETF